MQNQAQHIFLTGFMGSGKSTLGEKLASLRHLNFIDLDHYIEKKEKKTISSIFKNDGEDTFRVMETKNLLEILKIAEPCIIALGGGTVCFGDNLALIKNKDLLVYLELPVSILAERLKQSRQKRPLLKKFLDEDLVKNIGEQLEKRESYYKQSHVIVNGINLKAQILHQKILEFKKEHSAF